MASSSAPRDVAMRVVSKGGGGEEEAVAVAEKEARGGGGPAPWQTALAMLFTLSLGAMVVVQTGTNVELADALGHGVRSAFVNFSSGFFLLLPVVLLRARGQGSPRGVGASLAPWWGWTGGLLGAGAVTTAILVSPRLGLSLFFVAMVVGQLVMSLVLDALGALGAHRRPVEFFKLAGLALTLCGAVLLQDGSSGGSDSDDGEDDEAGRTVLETTAFSVAAVCGGAMLPLQSAINRHMMTFVGTPLRASLVSFGVGATALMLLSLGTLAFEPLTADAGADEFYIWMGGLVGLAFVISGTVLPHYLSMTLWFVLIVCGQMAMSLYMDSIGAFSFDKEPVTARRLVAVLLAVLGMALVAYARSRQPAVARADEASLGGSGDGSDGLGKGEGGGGGGGGGEPGSEGDPKNDGMAGLDTDALGELGELDRLQHVQEWLDAHQTGSTYQSTAASTASSEVPGAEGPALPALFQIDDSDSDGGSAGAPPPLELLAAVVANGGGGGGGGSGQSSSGDMSLDIVRTGNRSEGGDSGPEALARIQMQYGRLEEEIGGPPAPVRFRGGRGAAGGAKAKKGGGGKKAPAKPARAPTKAPTGLRARSSSPPKRRRAAAAPAASAARPARRSPRSRSLGPRSNQRRARSRSRGAERLRGRRAPSASPAPPRAASRSREGSPSRRPRGQLKYGEKARPAAGTGAVEVRVRVQDADVAVGEVVCKGSTTVADLREMLSSSVASLPSRFVFLMLPKRGVPVGLRQESRRTVADIQAAGTVVLLPLA